MRDKYILIATTSDRYEMLKQYLWSIVLYAKDWHVIIVGQKYTDKQINKIQKIISKTSVVLSLKEKVGMHNAKMIGLEHIRSLSESYVVCSADDDMMFTHRTKFKKALKKLEDPSVGFVSLGWVKHGNQLEAYKSVKQFVKQDIVYTGGGMLFTERLTDILLDEPRLEYVCDNSLWSVLAYINGYKNYRYRGSCTIHNICKLGGRRTWLNSGIKVLGRQDLLDYKPSAYTNNNPNDYLIPTGKDITLYAQELHKTNMK